MTGFTKASGYFMDALAASPVLTRSVMLGATALYLSDLNTEIDSEYVKLTWDLEDERILATAGIATTLYSAGFLWTMKKMVMQSRAALVASLAGRIVDVVQHLKDGKQVDKIRHTRGINQLRGSILSNLYVINKMKTTDDALGVLFMGTTIKAIIKEINMAYGIFDDTMMTLQYANNLGGEGAYIYSKGHEYAGKLVNHTNSILDAKDIGRMQNIANSQKVFSREVGTTRGRGFRIGKQKIRPFANKEIALAAEMFLPNKDAANDLFNIYEDIQLARANMDDIMSNVKQAGTMFDDFAKSIIDPNGLLRKNLSIKEIKIKATMLMGLLEGKTSAIGSATRQMDEMLNLKMLPKIATAELAAESFLLRGFGKIVEGSTKLSLKTSNALKITKIRPDKIATTATKVGSVAKVGVKWIGRAFLVDTVIWLGTGLYDIAFVEDVEGTYLGEHWGFSPVGWVIDTLFELVLTPEQYESAQATIAGVVETAVNSDTLSALVLIIADFYVKEYNLEILPFDIAFDFAFEGDFDLSAFMGTFDPMTLLEVAIYVIVIKMVLMQWVIPLWGGVGRVIVE